MTVLEAVETMQQNTLSDSNLKPHTATRFQPQKVKETKRTSQSD